MSYQVLARKWRPYQFAEVVGQSHVLTALANALTQHRLHHAYLFSGTRGVGKTTIARIFAKGLNCEQGITATPCGQCSTCQEIEQGRFIDLLEIDAASRTKVEDTRELLDNVQYKPARGRFKIYLIDEVHMLSRHSFNALLKTLEEPPEHVKFLLATTDPQKLPVTILSRCLQFHLKHLDDQQIKQQLAHVLSEEQLPAEPDALNLLAHAAYGSMRDALSLTDQAIALGNGAVKLADVREMLGLLSDDQALLLLEALSGQNAQLCFNTLNHIIEIGIEWDGLLKDLAAQLHHIALAQVLPESAQRLPQPEKILALSRVFDPQEIQLFYQIVLQGRQDLPYMPDGRAGIEMVLLRMLAFKPLTAQTSASIMPAAISAASASAPPVNLPPSTLAPKATLTASAPVAVSNDYAAAQVRAAVVSTPAPPSTPPPPSAPMPARAQVQPDAGSESQLPPLTSYHDMPPIDAMDYDEPSLPPPSAALSNAPPSPEALVAPTPQAASNPATANPILAARNMLRSRLAATQQGEQQALTPKKPEQVSIAQTPAPAKGAQSSVARVRSRHQPQAQAAEIPEDHDVLSDDSYRWQPTNTAPVATLPDGIAPKELKQALAHERTPEMSAKLEQEAIVRDPWSAQISQLSLSQRAKILALNSVLTTQGKLWHLTVRASQKHLISAKLHAELTQALQPFSNDPIELSIEIGEQGVTPTEWRDTLYQEKLAQAITSLDNDPNLKFICQRFDASIEQDSIRPR